MDQNMNNFYIFCPASLFKFRGEKKSYKNKTADFLAKINTFSDEVIAKFGFYSGLVW